MQGEIPYMYILYFLETLDETQMLVTRQQNPQSRYEFSLCQVQSEVIKPVFGVRADSGR